MSMGLCPTRASRVAAPLKILLRFGFKLRHHLLDNDNITLKSFFALCSVFFFYKDKRRKDGNDF